MSEDPGTGRQGEQSPQENRNGLDHNLSDTSEELPASGLLTCACFTFE